MLKTIDCPSYVQTYQSSEDGSVQVPVVIIPYDQFHSMMVQQLANNREVIEVNTILSDLKDAADERLRDPNRLYQIIAKRVVPYMEEK